MNVFDRWMCSAVHFKLFRFVARISLAAWLPLPSIVVLGPWYAWADHRSYSPQIFGVGTILLAIPIVFVGLTGFRRLCRPGSKMVLQVELRPGVLGLHVGKTIPKGLDLRDNIQNSVTLARRLRQKTIRIESPLLVKGRRRYRLARAADTAITQMGLTNVTVEVIEPKPMFWLRSLAFAIMRKLRRYDTEDRHLPPHNWFRCQTAGILLKLAD